MIGERIGRWTVTGYSHKNKRSKHYWNCVCECGKSRAVRQDHLKGGHSSSCGCGERGSYNLKHGQYVGNKKSSIIRRWNNMMRRCYDPKEKSYTRYGGRGIKVCKDWHDFRNFYRDMGDIPEGKTLDRIDNDGDYCKGNVRWATKDEQSRNRSITILLTHNGETKTVNEWVKETGLPRNTIINRVNHYKWSHSEALTTPARKGLFGRCA